MDTTTIAQTMRAALSSWTEVDDVRGDAQKATDAAREASQGKRAEVMLLLAETSILEEWEPGQVRAASKQVLAGQNQKSPTLAVFMSEAVAVALPHARERAEGLLTIVQKAFDIEKDADAGKKPCRKAFSRVYKAWLTLCRMAGDDEEVPHDVEGFIAYAKASDPDLDYRKVAKRLARIKADLNSFAADFPVPGFNNIDTYLKNIDEKTLQQARAHKIAAEAAAEKARMEAHKVTALPPVEVPPAIAETTETVYEPAEGVYDAEEAMLAA